MLPSIRHAVAEGHYAEGKSVASCRKQAVPRDSEGGSTVEVMMWEGTPTEAKATGTSTAATKGKESCPGTLTQGAGVVATVAGKSVACAPAVRLDREAHDGALPHCRTPPPSLLSLAIPLPSEEVISDVPILGNVRGSGEAGELSDAVASATSTAFNACYPLCYPTRSNITTTGVATTLTAARLSVPVLQLRIPYSTSDMRPTEIMNSSLLSETDERTRSGPSATAHFSALFNSPFANPASERTSGDVMEAAVSPTRHADVNAVKPRDPRVGRSPDAGKARKESSPSTSVSGTPRSISARLNEVRGRDACRRPTDPAWRREQRLQSALGAEGASFHRKDACPTPLSLEKRKNERNCHRCTLSKAAKTSVTPSTSLRNGSERTTSSPSVQAVLTQRALPNWWGRFLAQQEEAQVARRKHMAELRQSLEEASSRSRCAGVPRSKIGRYLNTYLEKVKGYKGPIKGWSERFEEFMKVRQPQKVASVGDEAVSDPFPFSHVAREQSCHPSAEEDPFTRATSAPLLYSDPKRLGSDAVHDSNRSTAFTSLHGACSRPEEGTRWFTTHGSILRKDEHRSDNEHRVSSTPQHVVARAASASRPRQGRLLSSTSPETSLMRWNAFATHANRGSTAHISALVPKNTLTTSTSERDPEAQCSLTDPGADPNLHERGRCLRERDTCTSDTSSDRYTVVPHNGAATNGRASIEIDVLDGKEVCVSDWKQSSGEDRRLQQGSRVWNLAYPAETCDCGEQDACALHTALQEWRTSVKACCGGSPPPQEAALGARTTFSSAKVAGGRTTSTQHPIRSSSAFMMAPVAHLCNEKAGVSAATAVSLHSEKPAFLENEMELQLNGLEGKLDVASSKAPAGSTTPPRGTANTLYFNRNGTRASQGARRQCAPYLVARRDRYPTSLSNSNPNREKSACPPSFENGYVLKYDAVDKGHATLQPIQIAGTASSSYLRQLELELRMALHSESPLM